MRVDDFDFSLPQDRVALTPARPRDSARLLHVVGVERHDMLVSELPSLLRAGDMLVVNDTKVIPAQLIGKRAARSDGPEIAIDVTLHKDLSSDREEGVRWRAFVRPAKRLRVGDKVSFGETFSAIVEARNGAECDLYFDVPSDRDFRSLLNKYGAPPLPPYISRNRGSDSRDHDDYQTTYAEEAGSVAAPTAGLHFTHRLLNRLTDAGILMEKITLHVGAGTFLPVTAEDTDDHKMHSEWGEITEAQAQAINDARARGGRIVAVGTTTLRLLESAAAADGRIAPFRQETDIFITPGYQFKAIDMLLTNFHLPKSTLFMLVCAFSGAETMKAAYRHAIENAYRFHSYGDACLLERFK